QRTWLSLLVGGVPGAMPPLIGWTAKTGALGAGGLALFAVMFLWQLPHFLAISIYRREEFARAGIHVLPNERGLVASKWHLLIYTVLLVPVSLALVPLGVAGVRYGVSAAILGAVFIGLAADGLREKRGDRWARGIFFYSLIYLTLLFAILA